MKNTKSLHLGRAVFVMFVVGRMFGAAATPAIAQDTSGQFEKVLLPLVVGVPQPGAFGSRWVSEVRITNPLNVSVPASGWVPVNTIPIIDPTAVLPFPAMTTFQPALPTGPSFIFIDRSFVDQIQITLRARDLSRQSQTWGTLLPIVHEREFVNRLISLNDIPSDSRFRVTLRVYSFDSSVPASVKVTVYGIANDNPPNMRPDVSLGSRVVALRDLSTLLPIDTIFTPGWVEIPLLDAVAPTTGYDRIRIDIEPTNANTRLWAFASVTNNETQHVTVMAPSF